MSVHPFKNCEGCFFYEEAGKPDWEGVCHRYPQVTRTHPDRYCGEWKMPMKKSVAMTISIWLMGVAFAGAVFDPYIRPFLNKLFD